MKITRFLVAALIALVPLACATNQPVGEQLDDAAVLTKIKTKFAADPEINPFDINIDVEAGVVRLSGAVGRDTTRYEAEKLAQRTSGVRRVINDIRVGDAKLADRWKDTSIATRVKTRLTADPEINPFNITVEVQEGVVTLFGKVASVNHRDEAEKLAINTEGVVSVKNLLEIAAAETPGEPETAP